MVAEVEALADEHLLDAVDVTDDFLVEHGVRLSALVERNKLDALDQVNVVALGQLGHQLSLRDDYDENVLVDVEDADDAVRAELNVAVHVALLFFCRLLSKESYFTYLVSR